MRKTQIKAALSYSGHTARDVSAILNRTEQNFSFKVNRETFKDQELEQIAAAIGAEYKCCFVFPDGKEI